MNATTPGRPGPGLTPAAPIRVEDQVRELQAATANTRWVKNCGDEQIREQWSAHLYIIEPGQTIAIVPRLVHPRDPEKNRILLKQRPKMEVSDKGFPSGSPATIVANLLKKCADRGLTEVRGDTFDPQREKLARDRYIQKRLERALGVQAQWLRDQEANAKKPGSLPLVMKPAIRAEIAWLRDNRRRMEVKRKKYISFDGFESDDYADVEAWVKETYPEDWEARGETLIMDRDANATPTEQAAPAEDYPEEAPNAEVEAEQAPQADQPQPPPNPFLRSPRATGRPAQAQPPATTGSIAPARPRRSGYDPEMMRARVEAAGLELTPDQFDGLDIGDAQTIVEVMQMLAEAT